MEPRKVANSFTLFTLHTIWLMVRGHISLGVVRLRFYCVWFFPQAVTHTYSSQKTQSKCQAAPNTSSTPEVKAVSSLSDNREIQVWITVPCPPETRFKWTCDISHHPKTSLAALQKQDKELVIQINAIPAASNRKKYLFTCDTIW